MSSRWNHSMCADCWNARNPNRKAVKVIDAKQERCCFCAQIHSSGIYIREDPLKLFCHGEHEII